jgi:hypothetical protein
MGGDDRWRVLLDRLATLRQAIVPGVLLGAVHLINDLDLSLTYLATLYVLRQRRDPTLVEGIRNLVGVMVRLHVRCLVDLSFLGVHDGRANPACSAGTWSPCCSCARSPPIMRSRRRSSSKAPWSG